MLGLVKIIYIPSQLLSEMVSLKRKEHTGHSFIWKKLSIWSTENFFCTNYNIDGKMYKSIKTLLTNTLSCIELNGSLRSEWFENVCGVRQGNCHQHCSACISMIWLYA